MKWVDNITSALIYFFALLVISSILVLPLLILINSKILSVSISILLSLFIISFSNRIADKKWISPLELVFGRILTAIIDSAFLFFLLVIFAYLLKGEADIEVFALGLVVILFSVFLTLFSVHLTNVKRLSKQKDYQRDRLRDAVFVLIWPFMVIGTIMGQYLVWKSFF